MSIIDVVQGQVVERGADTLVVAVGPLGLRVLVAAPTAAAAPAPGQAVQLYTHLHIREDLLALYGFATREERALFLQLQSVRGIGPKAALSALTALPADHLAAAIAAGDATRLARIPGIGAKTAARIVLDLKGKLPAEVASAVTPVPPTPVAGPYTDVATALRGLGFSAAEVATRLRALPQDRALTPEDALRLALQHTDRR